MGPRPSGAADAAFAWPGPAQLDPARRLARPGCPAASLDPARPSLDGTLGPAAMVRAAGPARAQVDRDPTTRPRSAPVRPTWLHRSATRLAYRQPASPAPDPAQRPASMDPAISASARPRRPGRSAPHRREPGGSARLRRPRPARAQPGPTPADPVRPPFGSPDAAPTSKIGVRPGPGDPGPTRAQRLGQAPAYPGLGPTPATRGPTPATAGPARPRRPRPAPATRPGPGPDSARPRPRPARLGDAGPTPSIPAHSSPR